jgi:hypothetical protein
MFQNLTWIDAATRMVALEFVMFSPSVKHFAYATLVVEMPAVGLMRTTSEVTVGRLVRYIDPCANRAAAQPRSGVELVRA